MLVRWCNSAIVYAVLQERCYKTWISFLLSQKKINDIIGAG